MRANGQSWDQGRVAAARMARLRRIGVGIVLGVVAVGLAVPSVGAATPPAGASGALDPTFGAGGMATVS